MAGVHRWFRDAECRIRGDSFDYLAIEQRRKEDPMETLIPLIAAVILLAALSVGETGARARRRLNVSASDSGARS